MEVFDCLRGERKRGIDCFWFTAFFFSWILRSDFQDCISWSGRYGGFFFH